jgi:hypothetical protein
MTDGRACKKWRRAYLGSRAKPVQFRFVLDNKPLNSGSSEAGLQSLGSDSPVLRIR